MRTIAVVALLATVGACSDAVTGRRDDDPHPGSAITATVGPAGGIVRTPNGYAAVEIPAGALRHDVAVTLQRVNTQYPTGRGPLRTNNVQYGAAYQLTMSPKPILSQGFGVALCAGEGRPFRGPDEVHHRLRFAFSPIEAAQSEETLILPMLGRVGIVNCAPRAASNRSVLEQLFAAIGPKPLHAIDVGVGGLYAGGCTHEGCRLAPTPFGGLVFGIIDPAALAR